MLTPKSSNRASSNVHSKHTSSNDTSNDTSVVIEEAGSLSTEWVFLLRNRCMKSKVEEGNACEWLCSYIVHIILCHVPLWVSSFKVPNSC
jgi:hypothetical protein